MSAFPPAIVLQPVSETFHSKALVKSILYDAESLENVCRLNEVGHLKIFKPENAGMRRRWEILTEICTVQCALWLCLIVTDSVIFLIYI